MHDLSRRGFVRLGLVGPVAAGSGFLPFGGTPASAASAPQSALSGRLRNAPKGPFPRQLSYAVDATTLCVQLILNRYVPGAFVPIGQRSGAGVAVGPGQAWWRRSDTWTDDPLSPAFAHGMTSASN